jgi:5'-nucleotidase
VEQTNKYSANCSASDGTNDTCYGGVARRLTAIEEVRRNHSNVLLLDAGDQFQGSIWFTYYKGLEASYFMNKLGYNAMVSSLFVLEYIYFKVYTF